MKNKKIRNLDKEVPKEIRLQVYKDTIDFIESRTTKLGSWYSPEYFDGLCMLLPAILWDFKSYSEEMPNGKSLDWMCTEIAFPELTPRVVRSIQNVLYEEKPDYRVKVLKKFITKLSKK